LTQEHKTPVLRIRGYTKSREVAQPRDRPANRRQIVPLPDPPHLVAETLIPRFVRSVAIRT